MALPCRHGHADQPPRENQRLAVRGYLQGTRRHDLMPAE
jgi:hypothetical protein